ncbi:MAG: hypothetical protein ACM3NO_10085 [Deltaproteobacteria bacterium]
MNQLVATVIRAMRKAHRRQLGACMGAPGPHDFAVRKQCRSSTGTSRVHRIPLHVRDDAYAPRVGAEWTDQTSFSEKTKEKYFCGLIWTGQISLKRLENFLFSRGAVSPCRQARGRPNAQDIFPTSMMMSMSLNATPGCVSLIRAGSLSA